MIEYSRMAQDKLIHWTCGNSPDSPMRPWEESKQNWFLMETCPSGTAEQLWDGGGTISDSILGGHQTLFHTNYIGGGACAPSPPTLRSLSMDSPRLLAHLTLEDSWPLSWRGSSNDYYDCGVVNLMHLSDEREPWGGEGDKQEFGQSQRNKSLISWEQDMIFWLNSVKILINGGWNLSCQISYPQFKEKISPPNPSPSPPIHIQPY